MANLSEDIQRAGFDTRSPMLDRTEFASRQQRIRLYCRGKENGVNILKSIDERPFQMGTFRETLAEGDEGALHLEQKRNHSQLLCPVCQAHQRHAELQDDHVQNAVEFQQHEAHANENKMMLDRFTQHIVDHLALMSSVSHQQETMQGKQVQLVIAQNNVGNTNQEYFKDKMLLMQAQENEVALDEERVLFITGGQTMLDEKLVQDLALNVDNVFQADECDAFDSDVDEAPTTQTVFMANLSFADRVYDEAGPSYDSDILSGVHDHDNYQDAICELYGVHEMHDHVQPNCVVDSNAEYTSDSNMIPYDQYVKDNAESDVQNTISSVPHDAPLMISNEMHEPTAQCVSVNAHTKVVDASLTAELAIYREQVELYERRAKFELTEREQKIEEQLRIVITDRNIKKEKLKNELHSVKMQLNSIINHSKSMVEEVTSLKKILNKKKINTLKNFWT
nr:retrovirus-related Pol polyprotein from transposon TNT 1-94 [Tanacetum cinerariifolium]